MTLLARVKRIEEEHAPKKRLRLQVSYSFSSDEAEAEKTRWKASSERGPDDEFIIIPSAVE